MQPKSYARIQGEARRAKQMALPLSERAALIKEEKERISNYQSKEAKPTGNSDYRMNQQDINAVLSGDIR